MFKMKLADKIFKKKAPIRLVVDGKEKILDLNDLSDEQLTLYAAMKNSQGIETRYVSSGKLWNSLAMPYVGVGAKSFLAEFNFDNKTIRYKIGIK